MGTCTSIEHFVDEQLGAAQHSQRWAQTYKKCSQSAPAASKQLVYSERPVVYYEGKESAVIGYAHVYTYNDCRFGQLWEPDWNKM